MDNNPKVQVLCFLQTGLVAHSALGRRPTNVVVHFNTADPQHTVVYWWSHAKSRVAVAPVVPDPHARAVGHGGCQGALADAVEVEDRLTSCPVDAVLVENNLRVGRCEGGRWVRG